MTPTDLDALAALLAAATPDPAWFDHHFAGSDLSDRDRAAVATALNALPALIEATRREAALREAIRAIPRLRLTGEQLDSITPPPQGADQFAIDWDEYDDFVPGTMLDALLHDNAGATEPARAALPAEGTEA